MPQMKGGLGSGRRVLRWQIPQRCLILETKLNLEVTTAGFRISSTRQYQMHDSSINAHKRACLHSVHMKTYPSGVSSCIIRCNLLACGQPFIDCRSMCFYAGVERVRHWSIYADGGYRRSLAPFTSISSLKWLHSARGMDFKSFRDGDGGGMSAEVSLRSHQMRPSLWSRKNHVAKNNLPIPLTS